MNEATVIAPGEGEKFWIVGDHVTFKIGAERTEGRYDLSENWADDGAGPPPHIHRREDELFYVLDGEQEFLFRDKTFRGGAGTAVYLPKDIVHTFRIVGGKPSRKLVIATPCGFQKFVAEAGARIDTIPCGKQVTERDIARLLEIVPKFGLELAPGHVPTGPAPPRAPDRKLSVLGQIVTMKLDSAQTSGNFTVAEIQLVPGPGIPVHAHRAMDEISYVLDGVVQFTVGDRTVDAPPGTLVHLPAGTWHGLQTTSGARVADFHTPGGFERFLEEAAAAPDLSPGAARQLILKHGMDLPGS